MAIWVDFKELRQNLKIADVLARHNVQLKIKGDQASGFCPLPGHQSKGEGKRRSPSFSANFKKNLFNSFSFHRGGNSLDLSCLTPSPVCSIDPRPNSAPPLSPITGPCGAGICSNSAMWPRPRASQKAAVPGR